MKYQTKKAKNQFHFKFKKKKTGRNFVKVVKDLHTKNYQTMIRETEGYSKKWKDSHAHCLYC